MELDRISIVQKNEITEHIIYKRLSESVKEPHNRDILRQISRDELRHYKFWRKYTRRDVKPDRLKIWRYLIISRIFGITFGIKLLERGEKQAQLIYEEISRSMPEAESIVSDENEHEKQLINLIDEERLRYIGSMVLGLNDALVELTGALAGFTFALQNTQLIAATGLITGIAASLSMAASEYLSVKSEGGAQNPFKAATYTGTTYVLTVLFLIFPYLVFENLYLCLGVTIFNALMVILIFTFYISIARDIPFRKRFSEMAVISLGIAALSFSIGFIIRGFLNVEV
ncbi:VIT1/CCC1 transporter family protein [Candidatus Pyrohabitans sp.]